MTEEETYEIAMRAMRLDEAKQAEFKDYLRSLESEDTALPQVAVQQELA